MPGPSRGSMSSGRGRRVDLSRTHPPSSACRGPASERIRAFVVVGPPLFALFNKLPQGKPGSGRATVLHSMRMAGDSPFASLRVCPCTPSLVAGAGGSGCARPRPGPVQRGTTSDGTLAFGHSRSEPRNPRRAHASRAEIGRRDWAAPEPVTGWLCACTFAHIRAHPRVLAQGICRPAPAAHRPGVREPHRCAVACPVPMKRGPVAAAHAAQA
jgi:hypothetical protein